MNSKRHNLKTPNILRLSLSLTVAAVLMMLMTACLLKIPTSYYRPEALGGKVVRTMEPRTNSAILFERQGSIIGINTSPNDKGQLYVSISFEIPDDKVVQLLEQHVVVSVPSKGIWKSKLSGLIWTGLGRTEGFPLDAPMIGMNSGWRFGTATGYGNTKYAAYFFKALLFPSQEEKTFEIKMPKFLMNNTEVELPQIRFILDSEDLWTSLP